MDMKPCPFCGDEASKTWENGRYGPFGYIECDLCGARSKTQKLIRKSEYDTEEEFWNQEAFGILVKRWNRRVGDK